MCLVSYVCLFFLLLTHRMQFKITCKKLWLHCRQFTGGCVWVLVSFKLFIFPPSIPTGWKDTQKVGVFSHPTTGVCRWFQLGPPGKPKGPRLGVFMGWTRNAKVLHRRRKSVSIWVSLGVFLYSESRASPCPWLTFTSPQAWGEAHMGCGLGNMDWGTSLHKKELRSFIPEGKKLELNWMATIHCCVSVSR